ncbi:hypothetical protein DY251_04285 [Mesorhizobium denitrificans]|uniref:Uncharacterized protein n=1 Tax=Mesorhizobium denitrificans TaxID=2294114 RepID=A0A371XI08_9HYPH|nr:hypothetical protein DY251_04285 [Mesorhizobium denitrificans]
MQKAKSIPAGILDLLTRFKPYSDPIRKKDTARPMRHFCALWTAALLLKLPTVWQSSMKKP